MRNTSQRIAVVAIIVLPIVIYFYLKNTTPRILQLPILGERYYDEILKDTVYHTIPDFQFTDQIDKAVSNHTFDSGMYVANFFFTTCRTICPKMQGSMLSIYEKYEDLPSIKFLSHTVDPEIDSVPVLKKYAENLKAKPDKWHFVTGKKEDIYKIAVEGYLLATGEDPKIPTDSLKFFHSQFAVLVDNKRRIRGVYDVLTSYDLKRLDEEIRVLNYELTHPDEYKK